MTRPSRPLSRRDLLRLSLGAGLLTACGRGARGAQRATDAMPVAPTPSIDDGDDDLPPPEVCVATADNIEGPFFKAGAPERAVLADARTRGQRLALTGRVLDAECRPLAGAVLDVWQADHAGAYDLRGWGLRGRLATGADGRWHVDTIVPGRYLNGDRYRPRHVHVKLAAAGHAPLTTQLYFAGDPYLEGDPFVVDSLIMTPAARGDGIACRFDFVLART
jgi:protocatechuate 3,4-dioxygenase beta subunit